MHPIARRFTHVATLYRENPQKRINASTRLSSHVQYFLDAIGSRDIPGAFNQLTYLKSSTPIYHDCLLIYLKLLTKHENLSIIDVKAVVKLAPDHRDLAPVLLTAFENTARGIQPAVIRYIRKVVNDPKGVDMPPHLLSLAAIVWPEHQFEPINSEYSMVPYLDSEGIASLDSLCQYICDTKVSDDTWETYCQLPSDERQGYLDDLERRGRQRQLEIERYCHNIGLNDLFHQFARRSGWDRAMSAHLMNPSQGFDLKKYHGVIKAIGINYILNFVVSRLIAHQVCNETDVVTITTGLARSFAQKLKRETGSCILSMGNLVELSAAVVNTAVKVCTLPSDLQLQVQLMNEMEPGSVPTHNRAFIHRYAHKKWNQVGIVEAHPVIMMGLKDSEFLVPSLLYMPMLCQPQRWSLPTKGGYLTNLKPLVTGAPELYLEGAHQTSQLSLTYSSLDCLGSTKWAINSTVLKVLNQVLNGDGGLGPTPCPAQDKLKWTKIPFGLKSSEERALVSHIHKTVKIANSYRGELFYLPQQIDFRGRVYPAVLYISHYQEDMVRGLLHFWEAKPLGDRGLCWLKYQLAAVAGKSKWTMEECQQWVDNEMDNIVATATDPWSTEWWQKLDKPWLALGICIELHRAQQHVSLGKPVSTFLSRQPVHQDGLCNGLQHFAALGADKEGGKSVNLVPGPRGDIYSKVLEIVSKSVALDASKGHFEAKLALGVLLRKLVKQTVMTTVYGVTAFGGGRQIKEKIKAIADPGSELAQYDYKVAGYLSRKVLQSVSELFAGASRIQDWLLEVCRRVVTCFDEETLTRDANPDFFSKRIYKPMMWTTLAGLPVVQMYKKQSSVVIKTDLQHISLLDPARLNEFSKHRQLNGILPNFVHLIDAIHMMMTATESGRQGLTFAAVHDSFWTHARDVDTMSSILRDEFVRLHSQDIVGAIRSDIQKTTSNKWQLAWVKRNEQLEKLREHAPIDKSGSKRDVLNRILAHELRQLVAGEKEPVSDWVRKHNLVLYQELTNNKYAVYDENMHEPIKMNQSRSLIPVLIPVTIPHTPERGELDINLVKNSIYFFS